MIDIFILEDEPQVRQELTAFVTAAAGDFPQLRFNQAFGEPAAFLAAIKAQANSQTLCFLDIDLGNKQINGIAVAKELRRLQLNTDIAFLTGIPSKREEVLSQRIKAIDYIEKADLQEMQARIYGVLKEVRPNLAAPRFFYLEQAQQGLFLPLDEVVYLATATANPDTQAPPPKAKGFLVLKTIKGQHYFKGTFKELKQRYPELYPLSKSYLIAPYQIKAYLKESSQLVMSNGDHLPIPQLNLAKTKRMLKQLGVAAPQ